MRIYKDSEGHLSVISVILNHKNEIIGLGDVEMPIGNDLLSLKRQLFAMVKSTRLDILNDDIIKKLVKRKKKG